MLALLILCLSTVNARCDVLVPFNSTWKYSKGTAEASNPVHAWRAASYDDGTWLSGPTPIYYGQTFTGGTAISGMRNAYTTLYLRKTFTISDPATIDRLAMRVLIDDGYVVWINGAEVARFNVPAGQIPFNGRASGTIEQTWVTNSLPNPAAYLFPGTNSIAVQVLNSVITSSDIVFNLQLETAGDKKPPAIVSVSPAAGQVSALTSVTVQFSEEVSGVSAADFLINNQPANSVSGSGATYTFSFPQPDFGPVDISWDAGQPIADLSDPPHHFDSSAPSANWSYLLKDSAPPSIIEFNPPPGLVVRFLRNLEVRFSEEVIGVSANDLLINGAPATNLQAHAGNRYLFEFPEQPSGAVSVAWSDQNGIQDLAAPPNSFAGGRWNYTIDPNLPVARVVISEFLSSAQSASGPKDEDGDLQDWIELHNIGSTPANLTGWSLTDDADTLNLWTFPDVTLQPDAYLIVFASAKDRKGTAPGSRLHTNFKLNTAGEYLALFSVDSPGTPMAELNGYPDQRDDYSYGIDPLGTWRYFQSPTPGQPNGTSSIVGLVSKPDFSAKRGLYDAPFDLVITNKSPGAAIYYTTDGSRPTETTGRLYTGPIPIRNSTIVRAIGTRSGYLVSDVATRSYIFPDQVIHQPNNPPGFPTGPTAFGGYPSDYEMDPEIVSDPDYGPQMRNALKALPTLSISIKMDDMFGAANGIYTHPLNRGPQWERPCSIEFIPLDGDGFQADAGIQVQGNASREPIKSPKHPLRVLFRSEYGPKKLDYRMFPDSPVSSFDTLVLRADFNNSWLHWDPNQRTRGQRTRDAWMKDSFRAMGNLASHNRFVHLYINGLYWGIYEPTERPDATFGEAYLGGDKDDYDVINEGAVVDGTISAYNTLVGFPSVSTLQQYNAIKQYLDIPEFIDYMLLHFYVGHEDWGNNKNWYMIRPRDGSRGFFYLPWDGELILGNTGVNRVSSPDTPSNLHIRLVANPQYRLDFADHVQRHFFNGGALTPQQNISRWMKRAREMELPIIAESARWGDYRRDVHQYASPPYELYTRDNQWRTEQSRLVNNYFPGRTATVLTQLRAAGLYPAVAAPAFNQFGGTINPGFRLQITAPTGAIYYTTNGLDPRVYGTDQVASEALLYNGPVTLNSITPVKARVLSGANWSALTEATFTTDALRVPLRITEILYNPNPPGDAFEFIELQNSGPVPFDTSGYYLQGVNYIFPPDSVIAPGQIILLGSSENPATFSERYPGVKVFGRFGGQLVNRGERIALLTPAGQTALSVDYNDKDGWSRQADGDGYSLEINDPWGDPDDPANWHASAAPGGSPGETNSLPALPSIRINEVLPHSAGSQDWVELYNTTSATIDLSGWMLEEPNNTNSFKFPAGTSLSPNAFIVVDCDKSLSPVGWHAPFSLDSESQTLILRNDSGATVDIFTTGPVANDYSVGWVSGKLKLTAPTRGLANAAAELGASDKLLVNEWLANAAPGETDWIEIFNSDTAHPVALRGLFLATTNQLFEITSPVFLSPGGYLGLLADENPGPDHVDFKLPAEGGVISLLNSSGETIDAIVYTAQADGISQGRFPDGSANIASFPISPTPGKPNSLSFPVSYAMNGTEFQITWKSVPGAAYRVESSIDLLDWIRLEEVTATNSSLSVADSMSKDRSYYRVIALPATPAGQSVL